MRFSGSVAYLFYMTYPGLLGLRRLGVCGADSLTSPTIEEPLCAARAPACYYAPNKAKPPALA